MGLSRLAAICVLATSLTGAWAPAPQAFDVASVKPSHNGSAESNVDSRPGGRLVATNVSVKELICQAFGVKDYLIARAPGWIDSVRVDINAQSCRPQERQR